MDLQTKLIVEIAVSATVLFLVLVLGFIYLVFTTRRLRREDELQTQRHQLSQESKHLLKQLHERELTIDEVGRDINANIKQVMYFVRMNLHEIGALSSGGRQLEYINRITAATDTLVASLEQYTYSMDREYVARTGLCRLLEDQAELINDKTDTRCFVDTIGDEFWHSTDERLMVYHIAIECIRNTVRHAEADTLEIKLTFGRDEFELTVADDGKGFDMQSPVNGRGLENMKQRAQMLGGMLTIKSNPDIGTQVILRIPVDRMSVERH